MKYAFYILHFALYTSSLAAVTPQEMIDAIYKPGQNPQGSNPAPLKMDVSREPWARMDESEFLPCFDRYGQFKWRDWPGKTHSDADLKCAFHEEVADIKAHRPPEDRDRFGGFSTGPRLRATGRFRTVKGGGVWWLVDPDGCLFWSFGPVRVSPSCGRTPLRVKNQPWRERMFEEYGEWGTAAAKAMAVKTGNGEQRTVDFSEMNLERKYGGKWFDYFAEFAHRRLASWGMNTLANDSNERICAMERTPYAMRIMLSSRSLDASAGRWKKFCDPFDPSFAAGLRAEMEKRSALLHSAWCIGLFVDNEILWGKGHGDLARWVLDCPDGQPAKAEFLNRLSNAGIDASCVPEEELCAFSDAIADEYFRKIRDEIKAFDPQLLYLGCRFAGFSRPDWAVRISAKYCDVMSFNVYRDDLVGWTPGEGIDKPVIIGEFHFGAHDRGLFGSGQRNALSQAGRAAAIEKYVESALAHPLVVGVHWHQYSDQAASGRFDGEHFQVGLTDICDRPYPETVDALRKVSSTMYQRRISAAKEKASKSSTTKQKGKDT